MSCSPIGAQLNSLGISGASERFLEATGRSETLKGEFR